jgi:ATP-dependent HslUV protease subunit HslV
MLVMDTTSLLLISGNGEIIEPDDGILAIGSGGSFALAAGRALHKYAPQMTAKEIAKAALETAAEICVFTNLNIIVEEIE